MTKHSRRTGALVWLVVAAALFGGAWVTTGAFTGCTLRDARLADELAEDPILNDARPGTTRAGDAYSGCDGDDGFAYAGREFGHPGSREDVIASVRSAAAGNGWLPEKPDAPASRSLCFTRTRDGLTVHLSLSFADAAAAGGVRSVPAGEHTLELTASHDGAAWC
ncbi:hypothetical protein RMN57_35715 [Kitasatospora sp. CM 4170]|uniref:Secreted protein n=1 Tax=Kitasatospora aburaviensis TaxID=67265 RepID=A0ABW1F0S1_9ACTN|nr:hypothetical protein [Kitasatospora sp. CM 4170]WNM49671.1 hypothetical protein RMN57_35715 [Kitasatospora sp. CM 4170]